MNNSLIVALLLVGGFSAAQNTPQNVGSRPQIVVDSDRKAEKVKFQEMSTQEKAELKAARTDETKSAAEKKAAVKAILKSYRKKRHTLHEQLRQSRSKKD
ncbi:MAG: hypothetical protein A2506_05950 [Elusimicrobia bacterium RIFOXYD12_FULL_66_9]|nr:MAG: hypothetical protein A2506_05950 [Elusimicrobia bacterium RIFOXYD12_FULL_66_9]